MGSHRFHHDKHTPARHAWLALVALRPGDNRRARGPTGYGCMALGWTQWVRADNFECVGEELTDAGRAKLTEWNAKYGPSSQSPLTNGDR